MIRVVLLTLLALVACLGTIAPASANGKDPAYVGTWASQPAQCKADQSDQEKAPLIMRRNGYDQHETHCTFSNIRAKGGTWTVRAACSVEGDKQTHALTLSVADNRLTMRDEHGPRVLQRCR
jgi:hypothetical protein